MDKDRQTGRTTKMVNGFPAEGPFVVVVHNHQMKGYIKSLMKPMLYPQNMELVTLQEFLRNHVYEGTNCPIFIDHFVWESGSLSDIANLRYVLDYKCQGRQNRRD